MLIQDIFNANAIHTHSIELQYKLNANTMQYRDTAKVTQTHTANINKWNANTTQTQHKRNPNAMQTKCNNNIIKSQMQLKYKLNNTNSMQRHTNALKSDFENQTY